MIEDALAQWEAVAAKEKKNTAVRQETCPSATSSTLNPQQQNRRHTVCYFAIIIQNTCFSASAH
jgi:hypothetical protein